VLKVLVKISNNGIILRKIITHMKIESLHRLLTRLNLIALFLIACPKIVHPDIDARLPVDRQHHEYKICDGAK